MGVLKTRSGTLLILAQGLKRSLSGSVSKEFKSGSLDKCLQNILHFASLGPTFYFSPAIGKGRIQLHILWQSSARLQVFVYDKSPSRCSMHNCFLSSQVFILGYSTYVVFLAIRIKPEMRHFPKIEVYKQLFTSPGLDKKISI